MNGESLYRVYESMVAGVLPLATGGVAEKQISYRVQGILGTPRIHYCQSVVDDQIYYLAVPSGVLASYPNFVTPLAAALPGGSADEGDGAYLLPLDQYAAVLIREKGVIRLMASYAEEVRSAINSYGLPVIDLESVGGEALSSDAHYYQVLSSKISHYVGVASMGVIAAAMLVLVGSKAVAGYYSANAEVSARTLAGEVDAAIGAASLSSPVLTQFERITKLSNAVVQAGGWIEGYEFSAKDGERFVLSMPDWVSGEVIKQMGSDVKTMVSDAPGLIWVIKNDRAGKAVEGKGPAPILDVPGGNRPAAAASAASKSGE